LSFFDEDDEPTRRTPRPRRPSPARGRPAAAANADPQQLWVRRAVAAGLGLLILLLLVFAVNSACSTARKNSLKDYNREVLAIVEESDTQVGRGFFELLSQQDAPDDLASAVSSFKVQAETQLQQAEKVDVPDDMAAAHRSLLIALEMRRDGLEYIAGRIPTALGDEGDAADEAITQIAGQMQSFLASDVLIESRVTPLVKQSLDEAEVGGQTVVATKRFLPDLGFLEPATVASTFGTRLSEGGENRDPDAPPAPGTHGHGLTSVTIGEVTLQPGQPNRVDASGSGNLTVNVKFANQGENDEFDVKVVVRVDGAGEPLRVERTVDQTTAGSDATANLDLAKAKLTAGEALTMTVEVRKVPGEQKTDNNKQTYSLLFTK
jgi:hypothetical protein